MNTCQRIKHRRWKPQLLSIFIFMVMSYPGYLLAGTLQSQNDDSVDFVTSILPVLEQRCFQCHSESRSEGDLRLDLESEVERGGHTGNVILGSDPNESELYLRITSGEEGFRMPKKGPALANAEIALFKKWIEQGSKWNDGVTGTLPAPIKSRPESITDRLGDWWVKTSQKLEQPSFQYASYLLIPLFLFVFAMAISYWDRRKERKRGKSDRFSLAWFKPAHHLAAVLLLAIVAVLVFQLGLVKELRSANASLEEKLARTKPVVPSQDPSTLPLPVYPMHPKRLGGVYYRGNDERSSELFNGGYYRTATMEIWLVDEAGNRLAWHDQTSNQNLALEFSIARAPNATSSLFSKRVMSSTFLTHFPQSQPEMDFQTLASKKILLQEFELGEKWETKIPIGSANEWTDQATEGMVYIHHGNQLNSDRSRGRIHFGIKYKIQFVNGKISDESEIWMGSLYNLNGRVLIPDSDSILLDRWFDFRPIPAIEGSNTTDPTLLGIPEHVRGD